jgi:hypothetical protein
VYPASFVHEACPGCVAQVKSLRLEKNEQDKQQFDIEMKQERLASHTQQEEK